MFDFLIEFIVFLNGQVLYLNVYSFFSLFEMDSIIQNKTQVHYVLMLKNVFSQNLLVFPVH